MVGIGWNDIAIVLATFLGPIVAVQAQKYLERRREVEARKLNIFQSLMATRQARLSPEHVRTLNMISLAFYGKSTPSGPPKRSKQSQAVMDAWKEYQRHLSPGDGAPIPQARVQEWGARGDELFLNLLAAIALATRFQFEREELRTGTYAPRAYEANEEEGLAIRRMLKELLAGDRLLPLDIRRVTVPPKPDAATVSPGAGA